MVSSQKLSRALPSNLQLTFSQIGCYYIPTFVVPDSSSFKVYENEDDAAKDLTGFLLANAIYTAVVKSHACEQSAQYDCSNLLFINIISPYSCFIQPDHHGQCFQEHQGHD